MKKSILALLIVIGIAGVWWSQSSHPVPSSQVSEQGLLEKTPEQILADDFEKITKNLNPKNIEGDEWKKINNYSSSVDQIVSKENAAAFFKVTQNNLPDIYSCLKKDYCGMTTRGEDDAYFDDQRTPAHILINRNLKVMKEALIKDSSLKSKVNWDMLYEMASSEAEMIQVEALDILREFDTESMKTEELIKLTEGYKGTAKADALVRLSKGKNPADKHLVASEVEEVFAMADANTVISVLENMKQMAFESSEINRIIKNLCRFKENTEEAHNWTMIKYEANKLTTEFEKNCQ